MPFDWKYLNLYRWFLFLRILAILQHTFAKKWIYARMHMYMYTHSLNWYFILASHLVYKRDFSVSNDLFIVLGVMQAQRLTFGVDFVALFSSFSFLVFWHFQMVSSIYRSNHLALNSRRLVITNSLSVLQLCFLVIAAFMTFTFQLP